MLFNQLPIILLIVFIFLFIVFRYLYLEKKEHLENLCSETIKDNKHDYIECTNEYTIPHHICQTSKNRSISKNMLNAINSWRKQHKGYKYYFYDNIECEKFIIDNYTDKHLEVFKGFIPGAFKADFFRYLYLYRYGGIYCDNKSICIKSLNKLLKDQEIDFITAIDKPVSKSFLYNAFICCRPKHPVIKICIDICMKNYELKYSTSNILNITGPGVLGHALNRYLGRKRTDKFKEGIYYYPNTDNSNKYLLMSHESIYITAGSIKFENTVYVKNRYKEYERERNIIYGGSSHYIYNVLKKNIYAVDDKNKKDKDKIIEII